MPQTVFTALCFQMPALASSDDSQVADELWLPMIPAGTFTGKDGRTWVNNKPDVVVAALTQKIPFDIEHATHIHGPAGNPAPASGWIVALKSDNGQILGRVEFNDKGKALIQGKEYAFYSPAFSFDQHGHVLAMRSAGLTNEPNLDLPSLNRKEDNKMPIPKILAAALSLNETASEDDAVAAVQALKSSEQTALNRAKQPDLTQFIPIATHNVALNRATTAEAALKVIQDKEIEGIVDAAIADGKVAPANKDMFVAMCRAEGGREQFTQFVESAPKIVSTTPTKTPHSQQGQQLEEHEIAMCRKLHISEEDFLKSKTALNKGA